MLMCGLLLPASAASSETLHESCALEVPAEMQPAQCCLLGGRQGTGSPAQCKTRCCTWTQKSRQELLLQALSLHLDAEDEELSCACAQALLAMLALHPRSMHQFLLAQHGGFSKVGFTLHLQQVALAGHGG